MKLPKAQLLTRAGGRPHRGLSSRDDTKVCLGGRGAVWWTDGEPDFNRLLAKNTSYAVWYAILQEFA